MSGPHLFELEPELEATLPWCRLGRFPTPVAPLERLGARIGASSLWIKRDDRTSKRYGGNKVRKLEWMFGDAVAKGAERLLTVGAVGSHHVLACAIHARKLSLPVDAILFPRPLDSYARRTLRATRAAGVRIFWSPHAAMLPTAIAWQRVRRRLERKREGVTYYIPPGASTARGCIGYVEAVLELRAQIEAGRLPEPRAIFLPVGSCGTMAGLLVGCRVAGLVTKIVGIRVVDRLVCNARTVQRLANRTLALLRRSGLRTKAAPIRRKEITLIHTQFGAGYGHPTAAGLEAIELAEALEHLQLEPTYTAKAMTGMLREIIRWKVFRQEPILFWNTHSSARLERLSAEEKPEEDRDPARFREFLARAR